MNLINELIIRNDEKMMLTSFLGQNRNGVNIRLMDLAEKLDVPVYHLKRIESANDRNVSLMTLYMISIVLDV